MTDDAFLKMLGSADEEERLRGLRGLGKALGEVSPAVIYQALGDDSWRVRKEAADLLLSLPWAGNLAGDVAELLHSQDNAGLRNAAVEILTKMGRPALPHLLNELNCSDQDVRKFALDILGQIGDTSCVPAMIKLLADPDGNVRAAAAENLGKIGSSEAVPALLEALDTDDLWFRFSILEALGLIGVELPLARVLLYRGNPLLKKALTDCLGRIGSQDAIQIVAEGLLDPIRNVREAAALGLVRMSARFPGEVEKCVRQLAGSVSEEAVSEMLNSADHQVHRAAMKLTGWLEMHSLAPRLLPFLEDEQMRPFAMATISVLGREGARRLLDQWDTGDARTRACIAYVIGETGCEEGLPLLLGAMPDAEPELRTIAAYALGRVGSATAIPVLVQCLVDDWEEVRGAAVQAMCQLGVKWPEEAMAYLAPLFESEKPELRTYAVQILGTIGGPPSESLMAFALKDESPIVRRMAVSSFAGPGAIDRCPGLILALTDEDAEVRRLIAEVLGESGDPRALQPLALALRDEDIWVRAVAARAAGRIGGMEAATLVEDALDDPVGLVCIAALESLAGMDPGKAYPHLLAALVHEDEEVVTAAMQLLVDNGQRDWLAEATDSLINHRHWDVRLRFIRLLAALEGKNSRSALEKRLLIEGEDLVRQEIKDSLLFMGREQGDE